jgi:hypothetical protein
MRRSYFRFLPARAGSLVAVPYFRRKFPDHSLWERLPQQCPRRYRGGRHAASKFLAQAVEYARAGAVEMARSELEAFLRLHPAREDARALLRSLRSPAPG